MSKEELEALILKLGEINGEICECQPIERYCEDGCKYFINRTCVFDMMRKDLEKRYESEVADEKSI